MSPPGLTFYHSPRTRSSGVFDLLEELGAPYDMQVVNMKAGEQRQPAFLAVNPMGKVPALRYGDELVTEQPAIYIFLADLFPERGLAPALTDPLRGRYLRSLVFYGSCFEPAVIDRAIKREAPPAQMSPYGDYETVLAQVEAMLGRGPYLLGDRLSAADILWGAALAWTTGFKIVPETPAIAAYVARVADRPAAARVRHRDAELSALHEAAAA